MKIFCYCGFLPGMNAFLTRLPDNADIAPTRPPIKALINNINVQWGSWNKCATRVANI